MKKSYLDDKKYLAIIADLAEHKVVCQLANFIQHANISRLDHCHYVSYKTYKICKFLRFNYKSAARGAFLHDFFLYDWHGTGISGLHALKHPKTALQNANKHFTLNKIEQDIIKKHMWPLTLLKLPHYKETIVVILVDKYCTCMEMIRPIIKRLKTKKVPKVI